MDLDSIAFKVIPPGDESPGSLMNRPEVRASEIPAGNISSSARALARVYASIVSEVDGTRLISSDRLDSLYSYGVDLPDLFMNAQFDAQTPRVLGYQRSTGLPDQLFYYGPSLRAIGHEGYGGHVGFADPDRRLGFGYTKTLLRPLVKDDVTGMLRVTRPAEYTKTGVTQALFDALGAA